MILAIEQDTQRFRQIVRGQVKQNLRKFMSNGELIGRVGRELVSIPLPEIALPRRIQVVEILPLLGTGKVDYCLLKSWAEQAV